MFRVILNVGGNPFVDEVQQLQIRRRHILRRQPDILQYGGVNRPAGGAHFNGQGVKVAIHQHLLGQIREHLGDSREQVAAAGQLRQIPLVAQGSEGVARQIEGVEVKRLTALHVLGVVRRGGCGSGCVHDADFRVLLGVLAHQFARVAPADGGVDAQDGRGQRRSQVNRGQTGVVVVSIVGIAGHAAGQIGVHIRRGQVANRLHGVIRCGDAQHLRAIVEDDGRAGHGEAGERGVGLHFAQRVGQTGLAVDAHERGQRVVRAGVAVVVVADERRVIQRQDDADVILRHLADAAVLEVQLKQLIQPVGRLGIHVVGGHIGVIARQRRALQGEVEAAVLVAAILHQAEGVHAGDVAAVERDAQQVNHAVGVGVEQQQRAVLIHRQHGGRFVAVKGAVLGEAQNVRKAARHHRDAPVFAVEFADGRAVGDGVELAVCFHHAADLVHVENVADLLDFIFFDAAVDLLGLLDCLRKRTGQQQRQHQQQAQETGKMLHDDNPPFIG